VDNDTVFLGAAFRNLLDEFNIAVEITAPYAHWQHGRIERQWGTLVPMAQSMIRQAALPKSYWALAMAAAVRVRNRVHSSGAGGVPFTLSTGRRADLSSILCVTNVCSTIALFDSSNEAGGFSSLTKAST
jgi:hypothetical protein